MKILLIIVLGICLISDSDETLVKLLDAKIDNEIEFYSLNCLKLNKSTKLNYNGNRIECPASLISRRYDLNSIRLNLSLNSVQLNQLLQFCNKKNDFNIVNKFNYDFRNILKQKKIIRYSGNNQQYIAILIYMISLNTVSACKERQASKPLNPKTGNSGNWPPCIFFRKKRKCHTYLCYVRHFRKVLC